MQQDTSLRNYFRLCYQEVTADDQDTLSTFQAKFQSAVNLKPNDMIRLAVTCQDESNIEMLKAVLSDPQASKIYFLRWEYNGKKDVNSIVPLLTSNCPKLASLQVDFDHHSALDVVSSVLEHPSTKVKVLHMPQCTKGDSARFFAALAQSQVSALTIYGCESPEFCQGLYNYLEKDFLVKLRVRVNNKQVPVELIASLSNCNRLADLWFLGCDCSQLTAFPHFPKSITELMLFQCTFAGSFDWSFLAGSKVRELDVGSLIGVDGNQLGRALAAYLRAKGLDELCLGANAFVNETLAVVGLELGRIKRLNMCGTFLNDASIKLIALVLQSPNSEMMEFTWRYSGDTMISIKNHLVPALRHPNCNLAKLRVWAYELEHTKAAKTVEDRFYNRRALFVLLQGQQVKRKSPCPLRRLPVEMFRLVGMVLI